MRHNNCLRRLHRTLTQSKAVYNRCLSGRICVYLGSSVVRPASKNVLQPFPFYSSVISESQVIANNRIGRVFLHTLCAFRDHHWGWHWGGAVRKFSRI